MVHQSQTSDKLIPAQHGFVPFRLTETALQDSFTEIKISQEENNYTALISLDFKNAFDRLPWEKTIQELKSL